MKYNNEKTTFIIILILITINIAASLSKLYNITHIVEKGGGILLKHTMLVQD